MVDEKTSAAVEKAVETIKKSLTATGGFSS
jgi:hypothetical protein